MEEEREREKHPRSWGQSVSTSGSAGGGSPSVTTPVSESTLLRLNHLDIQPDHAGSPSPLSNKKKKRGQRAVGGDKNGRGLRQFSMKVCEKVESKGRTTYNEVADELVAEFADPSNSISSPDQQQYDEKNIRRRVYDALNVLMAMDIISKDKKEIQWKGLPRTTLNDVEELKSERLGLRSKIEKKAAYLHDLEQQNLVERNEKLYSAENAPSGGVALPFILVQTRPHATVEVEISEDMQLVHFDFNSTPFELHDDYHVLKAMKFCQRPHQADDTGHDIPGNGRESSSIPDMFQPRDATPSRLRIPSGRPSASPPLPGILKARVNHER